MTDNLTISKTDPYLRFASGGGGGDVIGLHVYGNASGKNTFGIYDTKKSKHIMTISQETGVATFAGNVSAPNITTMQTAINNHTTAINSKSSVEIGKNGGIHNCPDGVQTYVYFDASGELAIRVKEGSIYHYYTFSTHGLTFN